MRPAGVPRPRPTQTRSNRSCSGRTSRVPRCPSAGTPPPATAPPSRRHLRTASELVGTLGGSAEDGADRVLGGAAASPRSRPAGGRPTAHNPWLLSPRAGRGRRARRLAAAARGQPQPRRDGREAVFGAPYVPSPTPRRAAEVPAAGRARGGTATTTRTRSSSSDIAARASCAARMSPPSPSSAVVRDRTRRCHTRPPSRRRSPPAATRGRRRSWTTRCRVSPRRAASHPTRAVCLPTAAPSVASSASST